LSDLIPECRRGPSPDNLVFDIMDPDRRASNDDDRDD